MLAERPDILEYSKLTGELHDLRKELGQAEWALDRLTAQNQRSAMNKKLKTREVDIAKVIGSDTSDLQEIDKLRERILDLKRQVGVYYGKLKVWEFNKELYISDSYHTVRGSR